jgi:hypothetical protein
MPIRMEVTREERIRILMRRGRWTLKTMSAALADKDVPSSITTLCHSLDPESLPTEVHPETRLRVLAAIEEVLDGTA